LATVSPSGAKHWTCGTPPASLADGPAAEEEPDSAGAPATVDAGGCDETAGGGTRDDETGEDAGDDSPAGTDGEGSCASASGNAARRQVSSVDIGNMAKQARRRAIELLKEIKIISSVKEIG
jgi:hypothetical protein